LVKFGTGLQVLLLTLKWEQFPDWNWNETLVAAWVIVAFLCFSTLLAIVLLIEICFVGVQSSIKT
jgi:ABC-type phosphate/phosphonate transport system permease subunit